MQRHGGRVAALTAPTFASQKRFDGERWYGHLMDMDVHDYKFTGELPKWMRPQTRTDKDEMAAAKAIMPTINYKGSYEILINDADRLNGKLNRKEFGNEIKNRLEKDSNTVARAQQMMANQTFSDQRTEDIMISRIADEEHVACEMKYVKCIRANEFAEDNRLDVLPGGSPNSLREKTRWNLNWELHPIDRNEIGARLQAWLPEKYHIVYFDDFQGVAAQNKEARAEMKQVVKNVKKELEAEAKKNNWEADMDEVLAEVAHDIDPTDEITADAIAGCSDLETLEKWSRSVHEYNGDERMIQIYSRAAEITKNPEHQALIKQMKALLA